MTAGNAEDVTCKKLLGGGEIGIMGGCFAILSLEKTLGCRDKEDLSRILSAANRLATMTDADVVVRRNALRREGASKEGP